MGDTPDTKAILDYTKKIIPKLIQQNKASAAAFKTTKADLEKAITNGTIPMLKLLRRKLEKEVEDMDDAMAKGEEAKTQIGFLQDDQAYADSHSDQILKLMGMVTDVQTELTERLKQAREVDSRAMKAWDQAEGSQDEGIKQLAVLKDDVGDLKKLVEKNDVEVPKLEADARKAFDARDTAALTAARTKLNEFGNKGGRVSYLREKVTKFKQGFHQYKDLNAEAQWLLDDLQQIADRKVELQKLHRELIDLGFLKPVDTDKAAKVLGITAPKDKAKLEKALSGLSAGYLKALDALAKDKDFQLKTTGKDMLAKLKSAKVL